MDVTPPGPALLGVEYVGGAKIQIQGLCFQVDLHRDGIEVEIAPHHALFKQFVEFFSPLVLVHLSLDFF